MPERAKPLAKRRRAYIQIFGERDVRKDVAEVKMHESITAFFLPSHLSATRPKKAEPEQVNKNE